MEGIIKIFKKEHTLIPWISFAKAPVSEFVNLMLMFPTAMDSKSMCKLLFPIHFLLYFFYLFIILLFLFLKREKKNLPVNVPFSVTVIKLSGETPLKA